MGEKVPVYVLLVGRGNFQSAVPHHPQPRDARATGSRDATAKALTSQPYKVRCGWARQPRLIERWHHKHPEISRRRPPHCEAVQRPQFRYACRCYPRSDCRPLLHRAVTPRQPQGAGGCGILIAETARLIPQSPAPRGLRGARSRLNRCVHMHGTGAGIYSPTQMAGGERAGRGPWHIGEVDYKVVLYTRPLRNGRERGGPGSAG